MKWPITERRVKWEAKALPTASAWPSGSTLAVFPGAEAAEQGEAGGELSPRAGLHPHQIQLRLGFLARSPRDEGMLVLKDPPEQAGDRGAERAGSELGTCRALSGHTTADVFKGLFSRLCALLP